MPGALLLIAQSVAQPVNGKSPGSVQRFTNAGVASIFAKFIEMYKYNEVGQVTKKRLRLKRSFSDSFPAVDLDADYAYDNESGMTSYGIPL